MLDDLTLAIDLVRTAGDLAKRMRQEGLGVDTKGHASEVVTEADRQAEASVTVELARRRPGDGVLGEEGAGVPASTGRTWVVDPVDGTFNFVSGLPGWCSAVALRQDADGSGLVGAIYQPVTGKLWSASAEGAWANDAPVPPLPDRALRDVAVATYLHSTTTGALRDTWLRLIERAATVRLLGSGSIDLGLVAEGVLGAFVQPDVSPWDWLPGSTVVKAAGGQAVRVPYEGHEWCLAGSERAVAELLEILN